MFYEVARVICRFVLRVARRWEVYGKENIPGEGGLVVVANHTSYWDPVIMGCCFERRVFYMAKEELFNQNRIFTRIITGLGAFPVKRGKTDRAAIKQALQYLAAGNVIGLFPEGGISRSGVFREARNGAALLALKAGVPVLPVGIRGAKGLGKVVVRIGKPIYLTGSEGTRPTKDLLAALSNQFMKGIAELCANEARTDGSVRG